MLDKGTIHTLGGMKWTARDFIMLLITVHNLELNELFTSGISPHNIFRLKLMTGNSTCRKRNHGQGGAC